MIEDIGDLWGYKSKENLNILRVITTNGFVKQNGELVMGRGVALQAKKKYPHLPRILGEKVREGGNHVYIIDDYCIVSFPVKPDIWWANADIKLIQRSAIELRYLTKNGKWDYIVMPRPGTGNGHLKWEDVKPILENELIEPNFVVLSSERKS